MPSVLSEFFFPNTASTSSKSRVGRFASIIRNNTASVRLSAWIAFLAVSSSTSSNVVFPDPGSGLNGCR